jgi:hypothetical protein
MLSGVGLGFVYFRSYTWYRTLLLDFLSIFFVLRH